jgi:D-alanyl-D-alanine carboxypeptidase
VALVSKFNTPTLVAALAASALATFGLATFGMSRASAESMLLIEAETGKVLHAENATMPWYPASITKVMTAYVTLQAVKSKRLTLDSLLTMSARAASQAPSKMGFKPGTTVTVDNALKMLMVKSANDIAYLIAEGVGGSVEQFSDEMNAASRRLGMTQSNWVNPNGLPAEEQVSSARDLAILARAMLREFPEYDSYWSIPAIKFGKKMMRNTNSLIGRYPGANGMKTGFICASGFNLVASASRGGKRLIAVVLGSQSSAVRGAKTAGLLERGFNSNGLSWLSPTLGTVDSLQAINAPPPDLREEMCGKHRKRPAAEDADDEPTAAGTIASGDSNSPTAFMLSNLAPSSGKISQLIAPPGPVNPIVVFAGPAKQSADTQLAATRAKIDAKLAAAKPDAKVVTAAPAAAPGQIAATPAAAPRAARAPAPGQIAVAPSGQFGPPPGQFTPPGSRSLPAVDAHTAPWMSFAPAAHAAPTAPEPLTAMPAPAPQAAAVPMPRPRPKKAAAAAPHAAAPAAPAAQR